MCELDYLIYITLVQQREDIPSRIGTQAGGTVGTRRIVIIDPRPHDATSDT